MNDKNLELMPDKDGFLFEIEDHSYVFNEISRMVMDDNSFIWFCIYIF